MKTVKLSNGIEMPQIGYGVYQVTPQECERCVTEALEVGYRMIDTAQAYQNEEGVGNAVRKSGIPRKDIFLVTKIWISNYGYERAKASIDESLRKLQTDYIDLMLLHQPFCDRYGAYRAQEEAYKEGKLKAIGVSNFYPDHLIDLASNVEVKPMVNQVETHVFDQQIQPQKFMDELDCRIMSWGPLAEGAIVSSRMNYWARLARSTASRFRRWPCAGCCSVASSSSQSRPTRSAWLRTSTSSTSNSLPTTWRRLRRSTQARASSSTITTAK